jgi:predicted RNA-binding Zn-ribbon protein involved in translation (DUF1610 family)
MHKFPNVVTVNGVHYNLEDACTSCGNAFECNEDGSTKAGAYVQISTQFIRYCPNCGSQQEWKLKKGKQPWLHNVDQDRLEG